VYLAERLEDRKKIAVKAFAKEALTVELKGRESLVNEINVMRALEHRCLMKLYEVFESDNSFYLVIEHLEGGQLFEKLNVLADSKFRTDASKSVRFRTYSETSLKG
jgi:serine/threonine protein kinase